jgi:hypothetical protein
MFQIGGEAHDRRKPLTIICRGPSNQGMEKSAYFRQDTVVRAAKSHHFFQASLIRVVKDLPPFFESFPNVLGEATPLEFRE